MDEINKNPCIFCNKCFLIGAAVVLFYVLFDVEYYVRVIGTLIYSKFFMKKKKPNEEFSITGFCSLKDLDLFLRYMSDSRYLRVMDCARFQYFENSGLLSEVMKKRGNVVQGACNIRYRKAIPMFSFFKVVTKLVYWDEKALYLEQRFMTGDFIRAIALSKQNIVGVNCEELLRKSLGDNYQKPEIPEELNLWLKSIEVSSSKLKKKD